MNNTARAAIRAEIERGGRLIKSELLDRAARRLTHGQRCQLRR
jgi:hypothetical protein